MYTRNLHLVSIQQEIFTWKILLNMTVSWWRHQTENFTRHWPLVRGIHRSPGNSPHKRQWRWALMFSLICAWTNGWANNRGAGDFRRHRAHYEVTVIFLSTTIARIISRIDRFYEMLLLFAMENKNVAIQNVTCYWSCYIYALEYRYVSIKAKSLKFQMHLQWKHSQAIPVESITSIDDKMVLV